MQLRTISASSLTTFEECPRRWHAENIERVPRTGGPGPAGVGTAVHNTLEVYVAKVYMTKEWDDDWKRIEDLYTVQFAKVFGTMDTTSEQYKDGLSMLKNWFERTNLNNIEVLSVEIKSSMPIKTNDGIKKYNYIWDRCDRFKEDSKTIIRVVDYKTIRANLSPSDLRQKIQARMYAVAAATQFKDDKPDEIWICFDLLRYGPVEVKFSRDELLRTWKYIKDTANAIIAADPDDLEERLSPGCMFCVRKFNCDTLLKNETGEGIMALADDDDALAERHMQLTSVNKASKYALEEIENLMLAKAKENDEIEGETENYEVRFTARKTRYVEDFEVAEILGPEKFATIGKVTMGEIDRLLKSKELSAVQKSLLRGAVKDKFGDMKPKVTKKT